jgi:beta-glucosidase/6-phospho-beta-glucosidase/beta-galactosidase
MMGAGTNGVQLDLANDGFEIWGGAEYTCNRVGDRYIDQMELSGHAHRMSDYENFVALGIRTLRFGLLWERHELDPSWRWSDERLQWMQSAGVRPIASLVHHGSGPPHTDLLDPQFPEKLAAYAEAVAQRYPWIDAYTPINEPHTTARFSAMYGIWYPHHRSALSYLRALLNQIKATVLSMQAVRNVRPDAQLIQTEDVGIISGTEELRPVWQKLRLRQWLAYDLLFGRVDSAHPMFTYLRSEGVSEKEILWFIDHPCPPTVIGINYYLTSDRYLDHRIEMYPPDRVSAEGRFVDVEAVRVRRQAMAGFDALLLETWRRYKTPVALTEVHLGGTVEDQIRWLAAARDGLLRARERGTTCVALTVWALLGSFYWNQLVTRENGHYEPGAFDVSGGTPTRTELASVVAQLTEGEHPSHAALSRCGWWQRDNRWCFPSEQDDVQAA